MKVSGRNNIEGKYKVVTVNALRAWRGVSENKADFTVNSQISDLISRKEIAILYSESRNALDSLRLDYERRIYDI